MRSSRNAAPLGKINTKRHNTAIFPVLLTPPSLRCCWAAAWVTILSLNERNVRWFSTEGERGMNRTTIFTLAIGALFTGFSVFFAACDSHQSSDNSGWNSLTFDDNNTSTSTDRLSDKLNRKSTDKSNDKSTDKTGKSTDKSNDKSTDSNSGDTGDNDDTNPFDWIGADTAPDTNPVETGVDTGDDPTPHTLRFTAISAGYRHTCGLDEGGKAHCWGSNEEGTE